MIISRASESCIPFQASRPPLVMRWRGFAFPNKTATCTSCQLKDRWASKLSFTWELFAIIIPCANKFLDKSVHSIFNVYLYSRKSENGLGRDTDGKSFGTQKLYMFSISVLSECESSSYRYVLLIFLNKAKSQHNTTFFLSERD